MLGKAIAGAAKSVTPAYVEEVFQTFLYDGNSGTQTIANGLNLGNPDTNAATYTTPGTYTWVCPPGVTSVSVVAIGGGANGSYSSGNGGGGLGYKNNISVVPGQSYTVQVGQGGYISYGSVISATDSYFINSSTVKGGKGNSATAMASPGSGGDYVGDGGGNGGNGGIGGWAGAGSGGAGGYSGNGGNGGNSADGGGYEIWTAATSGSGGGGGGGGSSGSTGGGGVGIYGIGASGAGGAKGQAGFGGSGGTNGNGPFGGTYGGGATYSGSSTAGNGAVRIVWPGTTRQFPSTNVAAVPDTSNGGLVWTKGRGAFNENHAFVDTVRGTNKYLASNNTDAEGTGTQLTAFNSNGYTLGAVNGWEGNWNGRNYASWTFRKQAKFFDVVTGTADNNGNVSFNHNLGSTPGCVIIKSTTNASNWFVYHTSLGTSQSLLLNSSNAAQNQGAGFVTVSSTSFSMNIGFGAGAVGYVAYLFAHDAGGFGASGNDSVISCGSFAGGGTVTLGWEPQYILWKAYDAVGAWRINDNMRGLPTGGTQSVLLANALDAETTNTFFDINPTGFKHLGSGNNYIYIAIRRGPMKTPTDATKVLYQLSRNGTGAETQVSGFGFPPDMMLTLWRSGGGSASQGSIIDKLRGNAPRLEPRGTAAEVTASSPTSYLALKSFDQDGVTYGQDQYGGYVNFDSTYLYMNYFFRRAPGFFDVVAYTGTGSATTVSHNLSVVPELMIVKRRDTGNAWGVYSSAIGATKNLELNSTSAEQAFGANLWNSTAPTSSVFSVGTSTWTNGSTSTYIAYLFASCSGVSKVGSYTGTGTTLSIDCGFTNGARFVLIKRTDSTGDWYVWDTARGIVSGNDPYLRLNSTAAEVTNTDYIDPLSSGFQISSTAPADLNANGGSYIFLAIA